MTKKMKETDVLKAMNDLPEEWIESCYETGEHTITERNTGNDAKIICLRKHGKVAVKWAVAAAAAVLVCGGFFAAKWGMNRVHASKKTEFQAYMESLGIYEPGVYPFRTSKWRNAMGEETDDVYFYLYAEAERIAEEELTGEIYEVREELSKQLEEVDYSRRWDYPKWSKQFETVEEAKTYIGYAGLKETLAWGHLDSVLVKVEGDKKGNIAKVALSAGYRHNDGEKGLLITEKAAVLTEMSQLYPHLVRVDMSDEYGWGESFRKEEYTNANGKTAAIVYEERENEKKGSRFLHGVLADGAVCYELNVSYYPEDLEHAKEIMYEWCEQF